MPILHLLAGPNGSGKSTYVARILQPVTHLPFINADAIAAKRWPNEPTKQLDYAYEASEQAAEQRLGFMQQGVSFITKTVFSHESKLDLVASAVSIGYIVHLHVILPPPDVAVARVAERVIDGGHDVPEQKIRDRYDRLWPLVVQASAIADRTDFLDNSVAATPFRPVAQYERGLLIGDADWPAWTPAALTAGAPGGIL